jgi:hypothetical protein
VLCGFTTNTGKCLENSHSPLLQWIVGFILRAKSSEMKNHPLQSKEPDFPRPSSAIARGRLHNRLVLKQNKKFDIKQQNTRMTTVDTFENDSDFIQPTIGYPSLMNNSLTYQDPSESLPHPPSSHPIHSMKSNLIQSHSLMVPGIESLYGTQLQNSLQETSTDNYFHLISEENKINSKHHSLEEGIRLIMSGAQEFCYLEASNPLNPYQLTLTSTPSNPSNPSYITLSKNWITRHGKGEPDQSSLKSFLKEYYVYHQIIKIPLFRQFAEWFAFTSSSAF